MANTIETNYDQWQVERYGNVIGSVETTPDGELIDSGIEEIERLAEYMNELTNAEQKS